MVSLLPTQVKSSSLPFIINYSYLSPEPGMYLDPIVTLQQSVDLQRGNEECLALRNSLYWS